MKLHFYFSTITGNGIVTGTGIPADFRGHISMTQVQSGPLYSFSSFIYYAPVPQFNQSSFVRHSSYKLSKWALHNANFSFVHQIIQEESRRNTAVPIEIQKVFFGNLSPT